MPHTDHHSAARGSHPTTGAGANRIQGMALQPLNHPPVARLGATPPAEQTVALTDPAMAVVTDFAVEHPVTVEEDYPIDSALREMKRANVRSMLVLNGQQIAGLVTSYDIQGERPMQVLQKLGFKNHAEVEVRHIMSPWGGVPTLELSDVRDAQVHQVVELFRHSPATHVLIIENTARDGAIVRGLISRTRVERQVGFAIT